MSGVRKWMEMRHICSERADSQFQIRSFFSRVSIIFLFVQRMNTQSRFRKNQCLPLSILNLPLKGSLVEISSQSSEYNLFYQADKKAQFEAYKISIQKTKLFPNLEIYEWRRQTEFPISKTQYVNIKQNNSHECETVELLVYIEHCPWKLNSLRLLSLAQAIYILKQSLIGYERLFKKFGTFDVNEDMIKINQKGFCRVWMNQKFANNSISKPAANEESMVNSIRTILQKYCQNSKLSQKLFSKLSQIKTFITALKQIDSFVVSTKTAVPHRFTADNFSECSLARIIPKKATKYQLQSPRKYRASMLEVMCAKDSVSLEKMKKIAQEVQIKKIKSTQNFGFQMNSMKKSDGQTAYSRNLKQTKSSNIKTNQKSSRQMHPQHQKFEAADEQKRLYDQCSFTSFGAEFQHINNKERKEKKDLYYSEAAVNPEESSNKASSSSFTAKEPNFSLQNSFLRKISHTNSNTYTDEFNFVLDESQKLSEKNISKRSLKNDQSEGDQLWQSHTSNVMKNNGWKSFTKLLQQEKQLNESFHEGQQQNAYTRQIKLEKLEKMGRRAQAMSILPEEFEEII